MDQSITTQPQMLQMARTEDIKNWYNDFVKLSKEILKENLDYGIIPGVEKPSLLKPGAEKLRFVYGLQTETKMTDHIEVLDPTDRRYPLLDFNYKCTVKSPNGLVLAECEGNCNSYESKFRFIWVKEDQIPSHMDKKTLKTRSSVSSEFEFAIQKAETTGQYGKPADYWKKYQDAISNGTAKRINKKTRNGKEMVAYEIGDVSYRIPNEDVLGLKNTIMKMAQKRAFVGAVLMATGASEFFTQDVEDLEEFNVVIDTPVTKPVEAAPAKKVEEGQVVEEHAPPAQNADEERNAKPATPVRRAVAKKTFTPDPTVMEEIKNKGGNPEPLPWEQMSPEDQERLTKRRKWVKSLAEKNLVNLNEVLQLEGELNVDQLTMDQTQAIIDYQKAKLNK